MTKKNKFVAILSMALIHAGLFSHAQQRDYKIQGNLDQNVAGKIYLMYSVEGNYTTDSTLVKAGAFTFTGKIDDPVFATLSLNPNVLKGKYGGIEHLDVQRFFLEGTVTKVSGGPLLKDATITGGTAQKDYQLHGAPIIPYNAKLKVLNDDVRKFKDAGNEAEVAKLEKQIEELRVLAMKNDSSFVEQHPNSFVAFTLWKNRYRGVVDPDAESGFLKFTPQIRATKSGKIMGEKIALAKKLNVGKMAPNFTLKDKDGKPVSLSDFKGKNVFLYFWYENFGSFPDFSFNLGRINRTLKDKNFVMLGVYYDINSDQGKNAWLSILTDKKMDWPNVEEVGGITADMTIPGIVAQTYGLNANTMPQAFLIGPDGKITARHLRLADKDLVSKLEALLQ